MGGFGAVLVAGFLGVGGLLGSADAGMQNKQSGLDRAVVEIQWPGPPGGPGYGQEWAGQREHCERMRERMQEIRYRMQYAPPWERDRLGARFYEIRERLRHECWGR